MILIFANNVNHKAKLIYDQLKQETNIPIRLCTLESIVKEGQFFIESKGSDLIFSIKNTVDEDFIISTDIKICYLAQIPFILNEWLPYDNDYDRNYARQEWWASLVSMFLSQKHIKFVNPISGQYDLNSEMEQIILFEKFEIPTVEMILTNNPKEAVNYYNLWGKNVLFKSIRKGYDTATHMQISDLGRLEKLRLLPAIFQKAIAGKEINICLVGNKLLAIELELIEGNLSFKTIDVPKDLQEKLIKLSKYIEIPIITFNFIYDEDAKEFFGFSMNAYPDLEFVYLTYGDSLMKILKEYLIEEYNQ